MNTKTTRIIEGVPGPSGEPGVLLLVPKSEALDWDLKDEVASTARHWMADRQAWWVAKPYASTAAAIVFRVYGARPIVEQGEEPGSLRGQGRLWRAVGGWWRRVRRWLGRSAAGRGAGTAP